MSATRKRGPGSQTHLRLVHSARPLISRETGAVLYEGERILEYFQAAMKPIRAAKASVFAEVEKRVAKRVVPIDPAEAPHFLRELRAGQLP